jgi:putative zinc finger/helix-turn-helix YgiT family protein
VTAYSASVKHDGRLYAFAVPRLKVPRCGACGEMVFDNDADEQVARALRDHLRLLQPEQIARRRAELGLGQKDLALRLGVAAETISRWEGGTMIQSRAMDNLLRVFFEFPAVQSALAGDRQPPGLGLPKAKAG